MTKCDRTFFKFLSVNSSFERKKFICAIDMLKTRNEIETKFVGKKMATKCVDFGHRNMCGMMECVKINVFFTFFGLKLVRQVEWTLNLVEN